MTVSLLTESEQRIYDTLNAMSLRIQKLELAVGFMAGYVDGQDFKISGEDQQLLRSELRNIGVIS